MFKQMHYLTTGQTIRYAKELSGRDVMLTDLAHLIISGALPVYIHICHSLDVATDIEAFFKSKILGKGYQYSNNINKLLITNEHELALVTKGFDTITSNAAGDKEAPALFYFVCDKYPITLRAHYTFEEKKQQSDFKLTYSANDIPPLFKPDDVYKFFSPATVTQQSENQPTPQSAYVVIGALLDLLTSQTTPRRNQSSIKTELEETGLKGLSKGSLDATFAKANKAIEQAKAQK